MRNCRLKITTIFVHLDDVDGTDLNEVTSENFRKAA